MKPKHIVTFAALIVMACAVSSFVTYRLVVRRLAPAELHAPAGSVSHAAAPPTSNSGAAGGCYDIQDAGAHVGDSGCVTGRLLRVYTSRGGNSFLDFCADYRHCPFTSVIFASDKNKFGDLSSLNGRQVEIHGSITSYQGRAEIVVHGPEQIRAAD